MCYERTGCCQSVLYKTSAESSTNCGTETECKDTQNREHLMKSLAIVATINNGNHNDTL
eukprot:m.803535 g.803535  ORF g.803535 m.803535 type:complete len:59 (+) comp23366_c2_seq8:1712-1888(+)